MTSFTELLKKKAQCLPFANSPVVNVAILTEFMLPMGPSLNAELRRDHVHDQK